MDPPEKAFPLEGILPKEETQAAAFLAKNPDFDGRAVVVGIFDTGVDPGALGMQVTSTGQPKVIDLIDCTGSGDVDTSTKANLVDGSLQGLSGRQLKLPEVDNPSGVFKIGLKRAYELFPASLKSRLEKDREEKFNITQREAVTELQRKITQWKEGDPVPKKELEARLEFLSSMEYSDPGPIHDVVLWKDSKDIWRVIVDVKEDGDLTTAKILADYKLERQFDNFGKDIRLNYSIKVYDDGNIVSIVVESGTHGTHVAGIVAGYHPGKPELNGIAPGAQIVGLKIGDSRLGTMETGTGLVRGLIAAKESGCDLVNMSYGEPTRFGDVGRFVELLTEFINKHNLIFVASAGNNGPALCTVGAPGGNTNGVIGVGAMVSPQMMSVMYSMLKPSPETQYTWSSRGPSAHGTLGVSVSAPGGAISNIPNWTLDKSQLMNGTSMSSPNCCGCIAVVLSALKAENIPYSPASIKNCLENTARFDPTRDHHTQGHGTVQVADAFTHAKRFSVDHRVRYALDVNSAPGLFLYEQHEMVEKSYMLSVAPTFLNETASDDKINFEKRFNIKSTAPWIKTPDHFFLSSGSRQFKFEVDPTALKEGNAYYAEVQGWDSSLSVERGPTFRFSVTVIKPFQLDAGQISRKFLDLKFKPGHLHRFFFTVPRGATWAEARFSAKNFAQRRLISYAHNQYLKHRSIRENMVDKNFWFFENSKEVVRFSVVPDKTIEICIGSYWSQGEDPGTVDFTIKFHGIQCRSIDNSAFEIHHGASLQTQISCPLQPEDVKYQAYLCVGAKRLTPTASNIIPLGERDLLPSGRQINRLTNTYTFTEEGTVRLTFPGISDLLYESPFEGPLLMIFDENKKLVETLDFMPLAFSLPRKGKYTVQVQFRHHEVGKLKALKSLPLVLEKPLPKDKQIALPLYPKIQNCIAQGSKSSSSATTLRKGVDHGIVIGGPDTSKIPSSLSNGDVMLGYLACREPKPDDTSIPDSVPKGGLDIPLGAFPLTYVVSTPPKSPESSSNFSSFDAAKSVDENFNEVRKKSLGEYIDFLIKKPHLEQARAILDKALNEFPSHLPFLKANVEYHIKAASEKVPKEQEDVVTASVGLEKAIDANEIALFFGIKHDEQDPQQKTLIGEMNKKKETLIFALYSKAKALSNIQKAEASDECRQRLKDSIKELSKWVKVSDEPKYVHLYIFTQVQEKNLSEALKAIKKAIGSSYEKPLLEIEIDLLSQAGWVHWAKQRKAKLLADFPPSFRLF